MVKTKATNENLGWTIFFFFCLFVISVGVGIYNDSRIDKLEEDQWFEWDNKMSFDECCLNNNKLMCPKGFMKVAIIFTNGSETKLDMSSFKMCNTHTSFVKGGLDE